jgi:streptomycin 6-kinase
MSMVDGRMWSDGHVEAARRRWSLTVDEILTGGKQSFVARVRTGGGASAVLKVAPDIAQEVRVLQAASGRGYVALYEYDLALNAALLEPLGPNLLTESPTVEHSIDVLAQMLTVAWSVPAEVGVPLDKAADLAQVVDDLWPGFGSPAPDALRDRVLAHLTGLRTRSPAQPVLCHGDPHEANAVKRGATFVFVDPVGFVGSRAYDLGVVMRGWPQAVLAADRPADLVRRHAARLSAATGVDEQEIWAWAFVERVTSALYLRARGFEDEGRAFLESAERVE